MPFPKAIKGRERPVPALVIFFPRRISFGAFRRGLLIKNGRSYDHSRLFIKNSIRINNLELSLTRMPSHPLISLSLQTIKATQKMRGSFYLNYLSMVVTLVDMIMLLFFWRGIADIHEFHFKVQCGSS
jgi:hypothetical protein